MQYIYYAVTPPKTTAANPLITDCPLTYGYLTSLVIILPKGCYGLLGLQLYQQSDLVFPANPNNWLTGDGLEQQFSEMIDLTSGRPNVQIATYNTDDTYTHTAEVIFSIQAPAAAASAPSGGGAVIGGQTGGGGGGDISPLPDGGGGGGTITPPDGGDGGNGGNGHVTPPPPKELCLPCVVEVLF
jgi:hypothetical protein